MHDAPHDAAARASGDQGRSSTRRWTSCCTSPAQLRPTALDDHGLDPRAALAGGELRRAHGHPRRVPAPAARHAELSDEEQLVIYRVTQESLSNIAQHADARAVDVELSFTGAHGPEGARRRQRLRRARTGQRTPGGPPRRPRRLGHARARAARRRQPDHLLRAPAREQLSSSPWGADEDPYRRRPRHRAWRPEAADRPPAGHGGRRRGRPTASRRSSSALQARPDLCVLDVSMPRLTGLQAARQIKAHLPADPGARCSRCTTTSATSSTR